MRINSEDDFLIEQIFSTRNWREIKIKFLRFVSGELRVGKFALQLKMRRD
jgi:hypothetical protein